MRKIILTTLALMLFCFHTGFITVARAGDKASLLIGWWREVAPSSNLVHFSEAGQVKIMLKKGEIGNLRALVGSWKIEGNGSVTLRFVRGERSLVKNYGLYVTKDRMILSNERGAETKHRRHSGPMPKEYVW